MKTPTPREWTDKKTGKTYWRVRWNDVNGKESVKVFGTVEEAEKHVKVIQTERERHGRAAAVNSDEISALAVWREFVAKEHTEGRDVPALRDVIRTAVERLREGKTTPALHDLQNQFMDAKEREAVSPQHLAALKNRLKRFVSYFDEAEPSGSVTTQTVEKALNSLKAGGMSAQTVKGIRAAAHGMFQWAMDRELVSSNPVSRAKAPKVKAGEVGTIRASQLKGLLRTALKTAPGSVPPLAVWAFAGVRRAELCRLRYEDILCSYLEDRVHEVLCTIVPESEIATQKDLPGMRGIKEGQQYTDFYIERLNLIVESDGNLHRDPIFGEENLEYIQANDRKKDEYAAANGITILRIEETLNRRSIRAQILRGIRRSRPGFRPLNPSNVLNTTQGKRRMPVRGKTPTRPGQK